jgi:hypothetical protein
MKCPFCGSPDQNAQELCLNCGRVLSYKNMEPLHSKTDGAFKIKDYVSNKKNPSLAYGMITIFVIIFLSFLFKTRPTGFFSNHNPYISIDKIREYEASSLDYYFLGLKNFQKGNYNKAYSFFLKAVSEYKIREAECYYQLGLIESAQKKFKKAEKSFKKALELNPDFLNPKLIINGIDSNNRFSGVNIENKNTELLEFSRIWQITNIYTRIWVLIKIDIKNDNSYYTVKIPPTRAPNKQKDILVYGSAGRFDIKYFDETIFADNEKSKKVILRHALLQFKFVSKGIHTVLFTIQAPFYEGVNPIGKVNLKVLPVKKSLWNEFFAVPTIDNYWDLKGFSAVKGPLKINFDITENCSFKNQFDGIEHIGFRKNN